MPGRCRYPALVALSLAVWVGLGCQTRETESRIRAEQEWNHNIAVVQAAVDGKLSSEQELNSAGLFLERLTGIDPEFNGGSLFLALPSKRTADSLVKWRAWFDVNKGRLRWDEATRSVVIVEPSKTEPNR